MYCGVHFYRSKRYQVLYQGSIHAVLIMSVLQKKTEFYSEVIEIAAKGLAEGAERLLQQVDFPIMRALSSHQIFSSPHESLSFPFCYLKWVTK